MMDKKTEDELFSWIDYLEETGPIRQVGTGNIERITKFGRACYKQGVKDGEKAAKEKRVQARRVNAVSRVL